MKYFLLIIALCVLSLNVLAQEKEVAVKDFHKVIVSPHIAVTFIEGEQNKVVVENMIVPREELNLEVKGKTLRVYLDDAKVIAKTEKVEGENYKMTKPVYPRTAATLTIYYTDLKELSLRGEESFHVESKLNQQEFRLKIYGESEVYLHEVQLKKMNVTIYGESVLKVLKGSVQNQKFKAYGESVISASKIISSDTKIVSYGEGSYRVNAQDTLKVTSFGESVVYNSGNAELNKGIVLGENTIAK